MTSKLTTMEKSKEPEKRAKNILVTGATRGLGLAIAEALALSDYRVIATGRSTSAHLESLINDFPDRVFFRAFDLEAQDKIHEFVNSIVKDFGGIYGLVNNAAIGLDGVLATMHDSEITRTINMNTTSTILMTKYCVRSMLLNKEGRIAHISSIIAHTGFSGLSVYAASKGSLIGFTKSLAREVGKMNITVNSLCPGYMNTDMTKSISKSNLNRIVRRSPMNRLIETSDVAHYVVYLMSEKAKNITGSTFTIDAGSTS